MINTELKQKVVAALKERRGLFAGSDAKFALSIGISGAQYSRIKNGDLDRVLSDANWISLARLCNVQLGSSIPWVTVKTPVFEYVTSQLEFCRLNSTCRLLCDEADIGKTHAAKHYATQHPNVVYVDCSQVKSKQRLVRFIAASFGVGHTGRYTDVYADLVFYLRQLEKPLVILDEAGDLDYPAFLELKALWNATEGACGWYMMGAEGLKAKIARSIDNKKVGYTELFSRYGSRYQRSSPAAQGEFQEFKMLHAAMIIQANFPSGTDVKKVIGAADMSLRRLKDERKKLTA